MAEGDSISVDAVRIAPSKNKEKYESDTWGTFYIPKEEMAKIGTPKMVRITIEAIED